MGRVKARDGSGRDESHGDEDFQPGRPQDGEQKLADAECDTGGSGADDDGADQAAPVSASPSNSLQGVTDSVPSPARKMMMATIRVPARLFAKA
jgi:hypothetical protein